MRAQKRIKILCFAIFGFLAVFCIPPTDGSDSIPDPSAFDFAGLEATQRFGERSTVHLLTTFYDLEGEPAVHLFLVTKNQQSIPEDLVESIEEGRRLRQEGVSLIEAGETKAGEDLLALSKSILLQEDEFGALFVSANQDGPSLIAYHHGLPTHLTARTDAEERAQAFFGEKQMVFLGVLFFSPLEYYYEFELEGEQILVSPFGSRIIERADLEETIEFLDPPVFGPGNEDFSVPMETDLYHLEEENQTEADLFATLSESQIIPGVPDYNQRPALPKSCGPTAGACLLGYWDAQGYQDFLQGTGTYDDVTHLIEELCAAMHWDPATGVYYSQIPTGLRDITDDRGYAFTISSLYAIGSLDIVRDEINAARPFVYASQENPWGLGHYVVVVGHEGNFIVVHDNWWSTPVDYYVNWDALRHTDDMMTTLIPQGQVGPLSQTLPAGVGGGGGGCFIQVATH